MKHLLSWILILGTLNLQSTSAQKFERVIPFYGKGTLVQTKSYLVNYLQFVADSAAFNQQKITSAYPYSNYLATLNKNGTITDHFLLHGSAIGSNLGFLSNQTNDDIYGSMNGQFNFYDRANNKVCDSVGSSFTHILKFTPQGTVSLMKTLAVKGGVSLCYSQNDNSLYALVYYVRSYDTAQYGLNLFRSDKSTLLKFDNTGKISKSFLVDSIFQYVNETSNGLLLSTSYVSKTNFSYLLNGSVIVRNATTDKYLYDYPMAIINPSTGTYIASTVVKCSGSLLMTNQKQTILSCNFTDSILINNQVIKGFGDFQPHVMFVKLDNQLKPVWTKNLKSSFGLYDYLLKDSSIEVVLRTIDLLSNTWDGKIIPNLSNMNRLFINNNGVLTRNYPIVLTNGTNTTVKLSDNSERYYMNIQVIDSLKINGITYRSRSGVNDNLFITYNNDTVTTGMPTFLQNPRVELNVFPNPSSSKFTWHSSEALSGNMVLLDLQGNELWRQKVSGMEDEIPLSGLTAGIYVLKYSSDSQTSTGFCKLVKE